MNIHCGDSIVVVGLLQHIGRWVRIGLHLEATGVTADRCAEAAWRRHGMNTGGTLHMVKRVGAGPAVRHYASHEVGGTCGTHGEKRSVYTVLVGRPEGKSPLGRPRRRWEDNIKMDLRETGMDGANWIRLARGRVGWWAFVNTIMNLRVP
jgi:hypothetical protein